MARTFERNAWTGLKRGLARRCPNCGEGHLFHGYLRVEPVCEVCGHDNSAYRADDGPAYFTILIVGHLLITPLAAFPIIWTWNPLVTASIFLPLVAVGALGSLAFVKGGFIGVQWATQTAPA